MTRNPDDAPPPEEPEGGRREANSGDRQLDEDAAWRSIVEHYGERASLDDDPEWRLPESGQDPPLERSYPPVAEANPSFPSLHRRYRDPLDDEASWEDEGHFVPPEPPPLPRLEPRRKLAFFGLFGAPLLLLLAAVLGQTGFSFPHWLTGLLAAAFIGGFVYLVATMPRSRRDDGSDDDGAVV